MTCATADDAMMMMIEKTMMMMMMQMSMLDTLTMPSTPRILLNMMMIRKHTDGDEKPTQGDGEETGMMIMQMIARTDCDEDNDECTAADGGY